MALHGSSGGASERLSIHTTADREEEEWNGWCLKRVAAAKEEEEEEEEEERKKKWKTQKKQRTK